MTRTKIIATLGPSTDNETVLRKMILAGLDVVRLNFSHGSLARQCRRLAMTRAISKRYRRAVKVMQDLEGYRIRVGKLAHDVVLKRREIIYLAKEVIVGDEKEIHFDYKGSLKGISKGNMIYIDDGKIALKVAATERERLKAEVVIGGILKERKGINIPEAKLDFESFTEKDRNDIKFAVSNKVEYLAQSFVRNAHDIQLLKEILVSGRAHCKVFAKIESRESLGNIDEIIHAADGIMIARGDLGICLPIYKVPVIQKEIIKKCRLTQKPVIVATQMLESMTEELLPTRAEVSDVANAILDGADFVMLSGETAMGKHPHKVVEMMDKIIKNTEAYQDKLKELLE